MAGARQEQVGGNVARRLAPLEVLDPAGAPLQLGTLWRQRPVVLVFIRHFG